MSKITAIPDYFLTSNRFFYLLLRGDGYLLQANNIFLNHFQQITIPGAFFTDFLYEREKNLFWQWVHLLKQNPLQRVFGELKMNTKENNTDSIFWEFRFVQKNAGEEYQVECVGVDIADNLMSVRNITTNEARLETIVSNSIDIQLLIDASGYVFFSSPNIQDKLGFTPEEIIGKNGFSFVHPEDLELAKSLFKEELTNPGNPSSADIRFQKKNGDWLWAEAKGKNLFLEPSIQGMLINLNDISERKKLEEELLLRENLRHKQVAQAAVDAQEKERADIGKELHDNISQMLTSTKLFLDILKNKQPDDLLERSVNNINAIIKEVRSLSRSLVPSSISDLGLVASLHDLLENIRAANVIDVEFYPASEEEMPLSPNSKLTLYRIAQEQINNIVRHSGATQVFVELYPEEEVIEMVISDNGKGFDPLSVKPGMGLKNIRSRSELLNGRSEIITSPGKGCKLKVVIPISKSSS